MVRGAGSSTLMLRAVDTSGSAALRALHDAVAAQQPARPQDAAQPPANGVQQQQQQQPGGGAAGGSHFDSKTDKGSAEL